MFKQISGSIGSIFASLCCLGLAPLLAALSSIGLGFIVNDAILIPMLIVFLCFTVWGLKGSQKKHRLKTPFYLGIIGAILAFLGIWIFLPIHIIGLILLVGTSIWDIILIRKHSFTCKPLGNNQEASKK